MNNTPAGFNQLTLADTALGLGSGISTLSAPQIVSGGTGYQRNDIVTVVGGTGMPAKLQVTNTGPNGVVTGVSAALANGCYSSPPSGTLSTTGGQGTGLTVTATFTSNTIPNNAIGVLIEVETQAARWRDDGVAPTASIGMLINANDTVPYLGNLNALLLFAVISGAVANITFQAQ